ncbi:hypothetical protein ACFWUZ_18150 [Streptomyces sp. NPDC058646]|uniref:hypothetical protein n=1 Tax=Streptomyces sp. NPDC058646 TaxID=3346574 RepID=UPI00365510FC
MSHDQSGPYGQQPPQVQHVPYGQPAPSGQQPYGQQGWGPPQQIGSYGPPPPQSAPRRKTGLIITGATVALAVIAGGAYFVLGGNGDGESASSSAVADSTKGYGLVAPESVDAYKKSGPGSAPGELNAEQKKEAEGLGVRNARAVSGIYNAESSDPGKVGGARLMFDGLYGDIPDPARALDNYFSGLAKKGLKGDGKTRGLQLQLVGTATTVKPAGFEGALMKCQDVKVTRESGAGPPKDGDKDFQYPVCAWADRSTLGGANVVHLVQPMTGGKGASQEEVAALTVRLYETARQKA